MGNLTQIRWHARGGQGAKTASDFVTRVAISEGKYSQAFPEYGPERAGAPMRSYTRISTDPIRRHSAVYSPDIVIILDPTLMDTANLADGLIEGGTILINSTLPVDQLKETYNLQNFDVHTIDASAIARDTIGRDIPNMPMVGAFVKLTGLLNLDDVYETLRASFAKKFGEEIINKNLDAIKRAHEEVQ